MRFLKNDLIFSICISGLFLSIIIILNFAFDLFKGFGGFSIQIFLVPFALCIYKVKNIVVSVIFLILTPIILFYMEQGAYIKSPLQVFIEYFLVFYIFVFLYLTRCIFLLIKKKWMKTQTKKRNLIEYVLFISTYIILIFIKFLIHSAASYYFWLEEKSWIAALSYNFLGVFINGLITLPILFSIIIPTFSLFDAHNQTIKNKY